MKSRKMVLMNLFEGQRGDEDMENRLVDMERKERVGQIQRVALKQVDRKSVV